ncbi:MAG TPA: hypothetical protein VIQ03_07530 [Gammaproteobacteria bacterium]
MQDLEKMKVFVKSIIHMHEIKDFEGLSAQIPDKELKAGTWFTEKRFNEVCDAIENEIGNNISLEYVSTLKRKTSYLTLWKATYTKTNDEVLWQIIFDAASNKIRLMHLNWEQV